MSIETKYRGWIPVLSGYISFRNASGQTIHTRCRLPSIEGDLSSPDGLNVKQLRELRDDLMPSLSWRPFRNTVPANTGIFVFSMKAKWTDTNEGAIHGFVYARPAATKTDSTDSIPPIAGIVQDTNGWILKFRLDRKGIVDLSWGDCKLETVVNIIDTDFLDATPQEIADRLTFQTYLFLKDFVHSHKFHNGDDDSILVPYLIQSKKDSSWYEKTARNLHASIVTAMRGRRFDVLNAMGQISYLKAFLELQPKAAPKFTAFGQGALDSLLAGCDAKLERGKLVESESSGMGSILLTLLFSFVAVIIAMLQLLQIPCISIFSKSTDCSVTFDVSPYAPVTAKIVLENWLWSVTGVYAGVLLILFFFFRGVMHDLISQRIGHRRWDWILLRPVFGNLLGDYGRLTASFWVLAFAAVIFGLLWFITISVLH